MGAVQGRTFIDHEEYARIEGEGGKVFIVYTDTNRLERHMKELAPEDALAIEEFAKGIHTMVHFPMPVEKAPELYSPIDGLKMMLKMLPYISFMKKWGKVTIQDYAQRFKNSFLREAFTRIVNLQNRPDFPMLAMLATLAWMNEKSAGYPAGGSLEFARAIERRYLALGGEIHYKSRVVKILVENDRAVGVRLADSSEHRADIVISAVDGRTTIFDMLGGRYINYKIKGYYDKLPITFPIIYVTLGVDRSFEEVPHTVTGIDLPLDESVIVEDRRGNEWVYRSTTSIPVWHRPARPC